MNSITSSFSFGQRRERQWEVRPARTDEKLGLSKKRHSDSERRKRENSRKSTARPSLFFSLGCPIIMRSSGRRRRKAEGRAGRVSAGRTDWHPLGRLPDGYFECARANGALPERARKHRAARTSDFARIWPARPTFPRTVRATLRTRRLLCHGLPAGNTKAAGSSALARRAATKTGPGSSRKSRTALKVDPVPLARRRRLRRFVPLKNKS